MITRNDLEKPRTPNEMKAILDQFSKDQNTYPDQDVHMRKGIIKRLLEEYRPLHVLANDLGEECQARLSLASNEGPDAVIRLKSGKEITIQITVADQSCMTALGREVLSQGKPMFPNSNKTRAKQTREICQTGRILDTREGRLRKQVDDVIKAIGKKSPTTALEQIFCLYGRAFGSVILASGILGEKN
jgi:3'-phosphoadenosine 5'-phosphosulfate sulfotransferase (PAPS reductase)/FAD synthetase